MRLEPGSESARDGTRRSLRAAVQRSEERRASRRAAATSIATACSGRHSPADTSRASIAASAKAPLNGPEGHGPALPRGLDALRRAAAATQGRDRSRQCRGQLLHLGRSVRHVRTRRATRRSTRATNPKALLALKDGKWVVLRVPYPLGFYTKWLDGRIDDPNAGWKGRGLWATISTRAPFHMEGGKGRHEQGASSSRCGRRR